MIDVMGVRLATSRTGARDTSAYSTTVRPHISSELGPLRHDMSAIFKLVIF